MFLRVQECQPEWSEQSLARPLIQLSMTKKFYFGEPCSNAEAIGKIDQAESIICIGVGPWESPVSACSRRGGCPMISNPNTPSNRVICGVTGRTGRSIVDFRRTNEQRYTLASNDWLASDGYSEADLLIER